MARNNSELGQSSIAETEVMVRHTSGKHLLMNAFLNDIPVKVVVDTAAMITLVNEKLICGEEHGDEGLVKLRGLGEQLVYGRIVKNVHIKIGSQTITWDVRTAPLRDDLILGLDFLEAHKAVIRLGAETVKINGELIQAKLVANQTTENSVARILLHETIKIPPNSMMTVAVPLKEPLRGNFIMEPVPITKVLIASSLCTGNVCPVNLVNDSNQYVKLRKDTVLGQTEAVSGLMECSTEVLGHNASQNTLWSPDIQIKQSKLNTETENEPKDIIPPHLRDMYDRAIKGLNPEERKKLKSLLIEYQDVFAKHDLDLGCLTAVKHKIDTKAATPVKQKMRRTSLGFQEHEQQHLTKMLNAGVIQPSTSAWASAPVLVRKKDGTVRWCVDYRAVNDRTTKDCYPLPIIEDCLDTLQGTTCFSTLDMASGYYQIELDEESRQKTAFITRYGLFEHTRMGFGLCNAPATFQRAMQLVLRGLTWTQVLVYLDDIIVLGKSFENGLRNLRNVLYRFREFNLKLKPKKWELFKDEVEFLG